MSRYLLQVELSEAERARVREQATLEGLTISDFMRRCINAYLLDVGDDGLLLDEKRSRDVSA